MLLTIRAIKEKGQLLCLGWTDRAGFWTGWPCEGKSKSWDGGGHAQVWGKSTLDRGNSWNRGPKAGRGLVCWENSKEASGAGAAGGEGGMEWKWRQGQTS